MRVRLTQIDGKLPNLALMRLGAWHRSIGDEVHWQRGVTRELGEPEYDRVYGSAIFSSSAKAVALFRQQFPGAIVGGSGGDPVVGPKVRTDCYVPSQFRGLDYSGYPSFTASMGYASRGCRSRCKFCVVPFQEGAIYSAASIAQIWRGEPYPRNLHLLDNDFFGNPDWRQVVAELIAGEFKVCINQGINVRRIGPEEAAAYPYTPREREFVLERRVGQALGSPETARRQLTELLEQTQADEFMLTCMVYDLKARIRSFELIREEIAPHLLTS